MLSNCYIPKISSLSKTEAISQPNVRNYPVMRLGEVCSSGVSGSAYIELGRSKIICSVSGPRPFTKTSPIHSSLETGILECEVLFASHVSENEITEVYPNMNKELTEKRLSQILQSSLQPSVMLELYPKSVITLNITIIQTSLYDLSAIINAGSMALADAVIQLRDIVCSHSMFLLSNSDNSSELVKLLEDPKIEDIFLPNFAQLTLCVMLSLDHITYSCVEGRLAKSLLHQCLHTLRLDIDNVKKILVNQLAQRHDYNLVL